MIIVTITITTVASLVKSKHDEDQLAARNSVREHIRQQLGYRYRP